MSDELQMKIEAAIIQIFEEKRLALGLSEQALGSKVYPNSPNARSRIHSLRVPQGNGKPRRLPTGELVDIARALGMNPVQLLGSVLEKFEETKL